MNATSSNRSRLALLGAVAAVVVAVPLWLILAQEQALQRGEVFRFRTAPVDPYDAFRGRYVALGFPPAEAAITAEMRLARGQKVFVTLDRDAEGFARFGAASLERPSGPSWLKLAVSGTSGNKVRLELPFDRFYMNELLAPEAEKVYRGSARNRQDGAWVEVRVYRGRAVVEDLYVDGRPIGELLEASAR